jgi:hypothetical protein
MFHPLIRLSRREVVAGITGAGKMLRIGRTVIACSCACADGVGAGEEGDPREPIHACYMHIHAEMQSEPSTHAHADIIIPHNLWYYY